MCSRPAVKALARAGAAAASFGTSELARLAPADTLVGAAGRGAENVATSTTDALGVTKPPLPELPELPTDDSEAEVAPPAPGATSVDSLTAKRRKRLAAMQRGLASTIATSPGGAAGTPSLLTQAVTGFKSKLGA